MESIGDVTFEVKLSRSGGVVVDTRGGVYDTKRVTREFGVTEMFEITAD